MAEAILFERISLTSKSVMLQTSLRTVYVPTEYIIQPNRKRMTDERDFFIAAARVGSYVMFHVLLPSFMLVFVFVFL